MTREELLAAARKHLWAVWTLSNDEMGSVAAEALLELGMLVPEGGAQELEAEIARLQAEVAELEAYRALELGTPEGRISAKCEDGKHPVWLRDLDDVRGCPWCRIAELEAQRERRRVRLVALQNDALSMRGSLSPNGEASKVPFPLGETLTPAVDWLIARVAELEAWKAADEEVQPHREATAAANLRYIAKLETRLRRVRFLHVKHVDSEHCQHDGEQWPCPTLAALDPDGITQATAPTQEQP
jgi:hypothetical protein